MKKILYVENDTASLLFVKRLLTKRYDFESATTDREALMKLKDNNYDLVLMDIKLNGDLDGNEVMKWAKDFKPDSKTIFIAVTTESDYNSAQNFLEEGFNGYFSKPLDIDSLISSIDFFVGKKRV